MSGTTYTVYAQLSNTNKYDVVSQVQRRKEPHIIIKTKSPDNMLI